MQDIIKNLIERYPVLEDFSRDIIRAYDVLCAAFSAGNKLLIAGNGGSCADADHISGELMKGFVLKRQLTEDEKSAFYMVGTEGADIASHLQRGLPAIALSSGGALGTAFANDIPNGAEYVFAQQVFVLGKRGDIFLGISTSGNSKNIINAAITAKAFGLSVISLTGKDGGRLAGIADVAIKAPESECYKVQELHLPIYHALCLMLEDKFFGGRG